AEMSKKITSEGIIAFAEATGDFNPVHIDEEAGRASLFGERIAHGMLGAGLISAVLGMKLPGAGALYLSQTLKFVKPVKIGDTITARAEVVEVVAAKKRVRLLTTVRNQDGETVIEGEAMAKVRGD
ncbi:MAG TPA: MaoC family dehydratase, partial [Gemmatimonadaceae bacterium]|nr:MaoC family dehydratase [Gemmatimonadaceae bacterium]